MCDDATHLEWAVVHTGTEVLHHRTTGPPEVSEAMQRRHRWCRAFLTRSVAPMMHVTGAVSARAHRRYDWSAAVISRHSSNPQQQQQPPAPPPVRSLPMSSAKFHCTKETLRSTLAKYGVAIIPTILDPLEITAMKQGAWQAVEHMGKHLSIPITQANPASWRSYGELFPMHNMLVQHWQVGHAQFIWDLRQNPKIVDTFATLWNCKPTDLLTSMDALSFHFPPETTHKGYFNKAWYHTGWYTHTSHPGGGHHRALYCRLTHFSLSLSLSLSVHLRSL
jgi:hypothetical protein